MQLPQILVPIAACIAFLSAGAAEVALAKPLTAHVSPAQARVAQAKARRQPHGKNAKNLAARRAKIRQRIRALRAWRLTEELNLDEATAAKLFPVINRFDQKFVEHMKRSHELRKQMRANLRNRAPAQAVNRTVDQLVAHQRLRWELQEKRFAAVRAVLTPAQAAKILVLLPEIDRAIQRKIRAAMARHRAGGPRGKRGNLVNPFDGVGNRGPRRRGKRVDPWQDSGKSRRLRHPGKKRKRTRPRNNGGDNGVMSPF